MAKPTKVIVDCSTGEESIVELTDAEIAENEKNSIFYAEQRAKAEAEAEAKTEAKASALAKLTALGLTEDEAKAIAG